MIVQTLNANPKSNSLPHRLSPNYALRNLAEFVAQAMFVDSAQTQTRDGFSFDVLGKSVLQSVYSANIPAQKYRDGYVRQPETPDRHPETSVRHPELVSGSASNNRNAAGTEIGTRYRYIDDTPLVPLSEAASGGGSSAAASVAKTRSRPNNEYVLYSYGEPVAMSADGNASYFGTDILGSVRSVTDKYGTVQSSYDYDAFGSPYLGNLENDVGFGYCGKSYDVGTGLYDYGFRDYSPISARFTTVDPIRDGANWFSYVVNDPVNYVDPFGLKTFEEIKEKAKTVVNDFVYGKQETIEVDGQKITVQKSSPLLKTMTFLRDVASVGIIATGNPLGALLALIPTGRVDNQTGDYLAFAGEHDSPLGKAYLDKGVTYVFKDFATTRGEESGFTVKTNPISNMTITKSEVNLSFGTTLINGVMNGIKSILRTEPGNWFNNTVFNALFNHPATTEPYNTYSNSTLLSSKGDSSAPGLSRNLKVFAGRLESNDGTNYSNPQYFQESINNSSNTSNFAFENISFNSSASSYIGFNAFSGGCTK